MKNKNLPLVTVITVTLNCEKLIQKTIESVRSQDYCHKEYIIVDGKSNDNTISIIQSNIDTITKLIIEKDDGIFDAMNKGIVLAAAESQFVTFLNAGDVFYDTHVISDMVSNINPLGCHLYGNITRKGEVKEAPNSLSLFTLSTNMVCHQAFFFQTKVHRKFKYDTCFKIAADYKLLLEMIYAGESFSKVNKIIVAFDISGVSQSNRQALHAENKKIRWSYPRIVIFRLIKLSYRWLSINLIQRVLKL